jgi:hypothetical protein
MLRQRDQGPLPLAPLASLTTEFWSTGLPLVRILDVDQGQRYGGVGAELVSSGDPVEPTVEQTEAELLEQQLPHRLIDPVLRHPRLTDERARPPALDMRLHQNWSQPACRTFPPVRVVSGPRLPQAQAGIGWARYSASLIKSESVHNPVKPEPFTQQHSGRVPDESE